MAQLQQLETQGIKVPIPTVPITVGPVNPDLNGRVRKLVADLDVQFAGLGSGQRHFGQGRDDARALTQLAYYHGLVASDSNNNVSNEAQQLLNLLSSNNNNIDISINSSTTPACSLLLLLLAVLATPALTIVVLDARHAPLVLGDMADNDVFVALRRTHDQTMWQDMVCAPLCPADTSSTTKPSTKKTAALAGPRCAPRPTA